MWIFSEKVIKVDSWIESKDRISMDLKKLKEELAREWTISKLQDLMQEYAVIQLFQLKDELWKKWVLANENVVKITFLIQSVFSNTEFDCWIIDWTWWKKTRRSIRKFQAKYMRWGNWIPSINTVKKIIEVFRNKKVLNIPVPDPKLRSVLLPSAEPKLRFPSAKPKLRSDDIKKNKLDNYFNETISLITYDSSLEYEIEEWFIGKRWILKQDFKGLKKGQSVYIWSRPDKNNNIIVLKNNNWKQLRLKISLSYLLIGVRKKPLTLPNIEVVKKQLETISEKWRVYYSEKNENWESLLNRIISRINNRRLDIDLKKWSQYILYIDRSERMVWKTNWQFVSIVFYDKNSDSFSLVWDFWSLISTGDWLKRNKKYFHTPLWIYNIIRNRKKPHRVTWITWRKTLPWYSWFWRAWWRIFTLKTDIPLTRWKYTEIWNLGKNYTIAWNWTSITLHSTFPENMKKFWERMSHWCIRIPEQIIDLLDLYSLLGKLDVNWKKWIFYWQSIIVDDLDNIWYSDSDYNSLKKTIK